MSADSIYDGKFSNTCSKANPDRTGTNTVCENWLNMQKFILKNSKPDCGIPNWSSDNEFICNNGIPNGWNIDKNKGGVSIMNPTSTLCPYPDHLFELWFSDCMDNGNGLIQYYIDNPSKENFVKIFNQTAESWNSPTDDGTPSKTVYNFFLQDKSVTLGWGNPNDFWSDDCKRNPYLCLSNATNQITSSLPNPWGNAITSVNTSCRLLSLNKAKFCNTRAKTYTVNMRYAAVGCSIGGLIGLGSLGQCNSNYNYDGLKDWIEDISRIYPEFESLSYLCAGTQISAFQCKLLENFQTQDIVYKSLVLEKEKLIQEKFNQPILVTTMTFIILILIIVFILSMKTFR
tara:strand:- start:492 stop:1523 length:1032 start_codon:yes stop_codon:yes gene_type:complete